MVEVATKGTRRQARPGEADASIVTHESAWKYRRLHPIFSAPLRLCVRLERQILRRRSGGAQGGGETNEDSRSSFGICDCGDCGTGRLRAGLESGPLAGA